MHLYYNCQNQKCIFQTLVHYVSRLIADFPNIFTDIVISNVLVYILVISHCDIDYCIWRTVAFITTFSDYK